MTFKYNKIASLVSVAIVTSFLNGCSSTHSKDYEDAYLKNKQTVFDDFKKYEEETKKTNNEIGKEHLNTYYIDTENYFLEKKEKKELPLVMNYDINYTSNVEVPIKDFLSHIFKITGVKFNSSVVSIDGESISKGKKNKNSDSTGVIFNNGSQNSEESELMIKPFTFNGKLKDMIDYVMILNNLKWFYDDSTEQVFVHNQNIEVFHIFEDNNVLKSENKLSISSESSSSSNGGVSGGNQQDITNKKEEDNWALIKENIQSLLSDNGKVSFNPKHGTVIVQDNDYVISKIRKIVDEMNENYNKMVYLNFDLLNVKLTNDKALGLNWGYANEMLKSKALGGFSANYSLGEAPTVTGYGNNLLELTTNSGLSALVGMLSSVGSVSLTYNVNTKTTNNTPVSFQISSNQDYIKKVTKENNRQLNDTTYSYETDIIRDGSTMTITPRIIGDNVAIDLKAALNTNDGFAESPVSEVQLKKESNKNFGINFTSKNGETNIVFVYSRKNNETTSSSPFFDNLWFAGGNESKKAKNEVVVATLTPFFQASK